MEFFKEPSTMTLTKSQLIEEVRKRNGFANQNAIQTVETTLEIIKKVLESGEDVLISGFGKFCVKQNKRQNEKEEILQLVGK
jgi:integration host factor subunit alpha